MIKYTIVTVILLFILLSCSLATSWNTHTNDEKKFRILYPNSWEKKQDGNMVAFLTKKEDGSDLFSENVIVMVQDLSAKPMTLEEYTNLTRQQILKGAGYSAIQSEKNLLLAKQKAKEMIYIIPKNPLRSLVDTKIRQIWFIKNNNAYIITYTAEKKNYDKYIKETSQIIDSFQMF